jgi:enoyl-CoA hydratase/carnithine racemase
MPVREAPRRQDVVLTERSGSVLTITINRPEQTNAISSAVRHGLIAALRDAKGDPRIRVVVLAGAGEEAFSTGLDVYELATMTPLEAETLALRVRSVHEAILALDVPTVAAIKGACVGSGLELALNCDLRCARADARFSFPGINIGLVAGGASVQRLTQLIGYGPAQALMLTGSIINAERAFLCGLVTNVITPESFGEGVRELANYLSNLPPVAVRELKALFREVPNRSAPDMARAGAEALKRCFSDGDASARLQALYGGGAGPDTTLH